MKLLHKCLVVVLLPLLLLMGCWDQVEITSLAPITSIGIDKGGEPGTWRISAQLSLPSGAEMMQSGGASRLRVLTIEADSMLGAFALMQSASRRKLFFLHLNFIVFGGDLAQEGIAAALEAANGWPQIRGSTLLFCAEGTAESVLHAHSGIGRDPGSDPVDIMDNVTTAPVARKVTLDEAVNALFEPGSITLTLPLLNLTPLFLTSGDEKPATGVGEDGDRFTEIRMGGTALFRQDRWVASLDVRQTQTLAVLVGEAREGISSMPNPTNPGAMIAPQYKKIKMKYDAEELEDGRIKVTISPQLTVHMYEVHGGYDLNLYGVEPFVQAIETDVRRRVLNLAEEIRAQGLDSLDIKSVIKKRKPGLWRRVREDWPAVYEALVFDSQPKAMIETTGGQEYYLKLGAPALPDAGSD